MIENEGAYLCPLGTKVRDAISNVIQRRVAENWPAEQLKLTVVTLF